MRLLKRMTHSLQGHSKEKKGHLSRCACESAVGRATNQYGYPMSTCAITMVMVGNKSLHTYNIWKWRQSSDVSTVSDEVTRLNYTYNIRIWSLVQLLGVERWIFLKIPLPAWIHPDWMTLTIQHMLYSFDKAATCIIAHLQAVGNCDQGVC